MRTVVIIPAFNEAHTIGAVVSGVPRGAVDEVIVVDNGSTDRTAEVAREAGARVIAEPRRGYGAACFAGAHAARADVLVFMDGDGADDPAQVSDLTPPEAEGWFAARLPRAGQALPQVGGSLAERLRAVFQALFAQGCRQVVAVDSDSPTLPVDYLRDAFRLLDDPAVDLVLGPALDGGYYAIGMRADHPAAFDVPMSTPDVLAGTLRRARQAGLRAALLPEWYDVDTPADLERLASDVAAGIGEPAPHVRAWLDKLDAT